MPPSRSGDGFPAANSLYADSQRFATPPHDPLLAPNADLGFGDTNNWGMDANRHMNPSQSRAMLPVWQQQSANAIKSHQYSPLPHLHNNNTNHHHHDNNVAPRALSHSPAAFAHSTTPFTGYSTPPNAFAYGQQPSYDPALFNPTGPPGREFDGSHFASFDPRGVNGQHGTSLPQYQIPANHSSSTISGTPPNPQYRVNSAGPQSSLTQLTPPTVDSRVIAATIPKGEAAGLFTIINFDVLAKSTKSERLGNFLNIGKEALEWPSNTATLPVYVPRKSRNDLKRLAGTDPVLLAKIARSASKSSGKVRSLLGAIKLSDRPSAPSSVRGSGSADDSKVELSSSSEESSDDDSSSYTSDEDLENSPLPSIRSAKPKEAVEYDVIKALWRSKRRPVDGSSIRKALADFWETVKTMRDRWKADTAAVTDAEAKKQVSDLSLLQSRTKDSRDMVEIAFKTALKHGHRSILEL